VRNKILKVRIFRLPPRSSWELRALLGCYAASSSISILDACQHLIFIRDRVFDKCKCDWNFEYSVNEKGG